jgi:hypothetical protein
VGAFFVGAYFVLRVPEYREWLLSLATHRPIRTFWGTARQWMAPRSCLLVGGLALAFSMATFLLTVLLPGRRLVPRVGRPGVLLLIGLWFQVSVCMAVAADLVFANRKNHAPWPQQISSDRVLEVTIGNMLNKAAKLRDSPESTGCYIAHPVGGEDLPDDRHLLHALMYPAALYPAPELWWPESLQNERWNAFLGSQWQSRNAKKPPGADALSVDISVVTFPKYIVVPCP